jgi:hypothetical protein
VLLQEILGGKGVFQAQVEGTFPAFLQHFGDQRVAGAEDILVEMNLEVSDFAGSDALQKIDDLLFHFLVVRYENVLPSTLNRSASDHVKAHSVSYANHVGSCNVAATHISNDLNNLLCVTDLTVSQQNDVANVVLHFLFHLYDVHQRRCYLCASEIGVKLLDEIDSLF